MTTSANERPQHALSQRRVRLAPLIMITAIAPSTLPTVHRVERRMKGWSIVLFFLCSVPLAASLFWKPGWLWMDEVLSTLFINDHSLAHVNDAIVSGMDANPPLFPNVFWLIGHLVSSDPTFLRVVCVAIFAGTIAYFHRFVTSLLGRPGLNFLLIAVIVATTYLNLWLAPQIRSYALFQALALIYFIAAHRLLLAPTEGRALVVHFLAGLGLVAVHNFGLFYFASSGAVFLFAAIVSRGRCSFRPLLTFAAVGYLWFVWWFPSFTIQARAGEPHTWIELPTFISFFHTVGSLAPAISSALEHRFEFLPVLRFAFITGLFGWVAVAKLKENRGNPWQDRAFVFHVFSGFVYFATIAMALVVSLVHTSIFLNRYLWPSQLLVMFQLVYAAHFFLGNSRWHPSGAVLTAASLLLGGFIFYQGKKVVIFPRQIVPFLNQLPADVPVFVETSDYFLPLWFHRIGIPVHYVLDWESAVQPGNIRNATVENRIMNGVREKYALAGIETLSDFNGKNFPHFFFVDESSVYHVERFIRTHRIKVIREIPVGVAGHRILECTFAAPSPRS